MMVHETRFAILVVTERFYNIIMNDTFLVGRFVGLPLTVHFGDLSVGRSVRRSVRNAFVKIDEK